MRPLLIEKIAIFKYTCVLRDHFFHDHLHSFSSRPRHRRGFIQCQHANISMTGWENPSAPRGVLGLTASDRLPRITGVCGAYRKGIGLSEPRLWQPRALNYKVRRLLSMSSIHHHKASQTISPNWFHSSPYSFPIIKTFLPSFSLPLSSSRPRTLSLCLPQSTLNTTTRPAHPLASNGSIKRSVPLSFFSTISKMACSPQTEVLISMSVLTSSVPPAF